MPPSGSVRKARGVEEIPPAFATRPVECARRLAWRLVSARARPQEGDVADPDDDELLNIYLMTDMRLSDLVSKMERTLLELRRRTDSLRCLRLRLLDRTATVHECRALES